MVCSPGVRSRAIAASAVAAIGLAGLLAVAVGPAMVERSAAQGDDGGPDFAYPTRHFRVPNSADLSAAEAMSVYQAAERPTRR